MLDGVPDLPGIVAVSVYDTKPVNFLYCCVAMPLNGFIKKRQVYDPKTQMVRDAPIFGV